MWYLDYEVSFTETENGAERLQKYLNDNGVILANYSVKNETLESVYMKAVRNNAV